LLNIYSKQTDANVKNTIEKNIANKTLPLDYATLPVDQLTVLSSFSDPVISVAAAQELSKRSTDSVNVNIIWPLLNQLTMSDRALAQASVPFQKLDSLGIPAFGPLTQNLLNANAVLNTRLWSADLVGLIGTFDASFSVLTQVVVAGGSPVNLRAEAVYSLTELFQRQPKNTTQTYLIDNRAFVQVAARMALAVTDTSTAKGNYEWVAANYAIVDTFPWLYESRYTAIVRLGAVGDTLTSLPLLQDIADNDPDAAIRQAAQNSASIIQARNKHSFNFDGVLSNTALAAAAVTPVKDSAKRPKKSLLFTAVALGVLAMGALMGCSNYNPVTSNDNNNPPIINPIVTDTLTAKEDSLRGDAVYTWANVPFVSFDSALALRLSNEIAAIGLNRGIIQPLIIAYLFKNGEPSDLQYNIVDTTILKKMVSFTSQSQQLSGLSILTQDPTFLSLRKIYISKYNSTGDDSTSEFQARKFKGYKALVYFLLEGNAKVVQDSAYKKLYKILSTPDISKLDMNYVKYDTSHVDILDVAAGVVVSRGDMFAAVKIALLLRKAGTPAAFQSILGHFYWDGNRGNVLDTLRDSVVSNVAVNLSPADINTLSGVFAGANDATFKSGIVEILFKRRTSAALDTAVALLKTSDQLKSYLALDYYNRGVADSLAQNIYDVEGKAVLQALIAGETNPDLKAKYQSVLDRNASGLPKKSSQSDPKGSLPAGSDFPENAFPVPVAGARIKKEDSVEPVDPEDKMPGGVALNAIPVQVRGHGATVGAVKVGPISLNGLTIKQIKMEEIPSLRNAINSERH
jgi:hypothetical protein